MSTTPFRGTLIFVGGIAAVAVTSVARFAGADTAAPAVAGAAGGVSAPTATSAPAGSSDASSSGSTGGSSDSPSNGSSGTPTGTATTPATGGSSTADPAASATTDPAVAGDTVTIVGSTVQTRFGPLQLSVTFAGSDITDVQALQYPSWHGESVQINQYAIPVLDQEAVAADSARIDSVSGATITSQAYKESLQAAIDQRG